MNLEKILYVIAIIFLVLFIVSVILIITSTLNMWLAGIVSLIVFFISFITIQIIKKKVNK